MAYARRRKGARVMRRRRRYPYKMGLKKMVSLVRTANLKSDVHYLSRYAPSVDKTSLATTGAEAGVGLVFKMSNVGNPQEFLMFDNFKIIGVSLTFRLMENPDSNNTINTNATTQASNFYPKLWWVVDRDDGVTPTVASIRERASARCKILMPNRFVRVFVKYPRPIIATASGPGYTNPPRECWYRTNEGYNPDNPAQELGFYGLKVVLDKMGYTGNQFTVGIDKKYIFAFKNTK